MPSRATVARQARTLRRLSPWAMRMSRTPVTTVAAEAASPTTPGTTSVKRSRTLRVCRSPVTTSSSPMT